VQAFVGANDVYAQMNAPLVGVLRNTTKLDAEFRMIAFRRGLEQFGYTPGSNVRIEYRYADGNYDRLPALAEDLLQRPASVLFASGNASAFAAAKATATIPVVFGSGTTPWKWG
jgi:ABC-type uncharacterized transport system substrate-binding protein